MAFGSSTITTGPPPSAAARAPTSSWRKLYALLSCARTSGPHNKTSAGRKNRVRVQIRMEGSGYGSQTEGNLRKCPERYKKHQSCLDFTQRVIETRLVL